MICATKKREAEFIKDIRSLSPDAYAEQYLRFSAAPILAGVKPAALISFHHSCKSVWHICKANICEKIGLNAIDLYDNKDSCK